jgi:DNA-binding NarL/FixJ family response regulator
MVSGDSVRVVMADDHARIRSLIRQALEAGGCEVVGEAANAEEAVAMTVAHRPDVVLLDIHMPGNGISATAELTQKMPDVPIVMLTSSYEEDDLFDSLRAGASGYLLKGGDPAELSEALRRVLAGEPAITPRLVIRIMDEFRAPSRRRFARRSAAAARLSEREWEVMNLLGQGLSTDEVARRLFLSATTVRVHVSTVLKKLRVRDRDSALRLLRDE